MSATLDGARVAGLLGDAPVLESEGRSFPVEIRYEERAPATVAVEDAVAKAIREALAAESGSVLAFLPGQREIERTAERLAGRVGADVDIVPLYGNLDGKAQDAAIRPAPAGRRKVVLATVDRRDLDHHRRRARGRRLRPVAAAEIRAGDRASRGSRPCASAGRPPTSGPAAPAARSRASRSGCGAPSRPRRCRPSRRRRSSKPTFPACCSTAPPSASPIRRRFPSSIRRRLPALDEARALLADARRDRRRRPASPQRARRCAGSPCRCGWRIWSARPRRPAQALEAAQLAVLITERGLGGDSADLERRLSRFAGRTIAARHGGAAAGGAAGAGFTAPLRAGPAANAQAGPSVRSPRPARRATASVGKPAAPAS